MELSTEDQFRLNVLLAQELLAVRIDESRMIVHALSERGEAKVPLHPTGRDETYLRLVRQTLSSHVLGSPGGYPVYLKRWTRMGQARSESLERLLLLGEPEAVAAVVHAPGLTDELARRAWWADPSAENARRMLERSCVATGTMGPVLAEFLLEFLPFEQEPQAIIDSVRLVLQPGLIDAQGRAQLWARGRRKNIYFVGFLQAIPDELPVDVAPHPRYEVLVHAVQPLVAAGNPVAVQLLRLLSAPGQAFVQTLSQVLRKPANQDVVVAVLDAVWAYLGPVRVDATRHRRIEDLLAAATACCQPGGRWERESAALVELMPEARDWIQALFVLSMVSEQLVAPIFGLTDAIGTVMRRRIEPVSGPVLEQLAVLGARGE